MNGECNREAYVIIGKADSIMLRGLEASKSRSGVIKREERMTTLNTFEKPSGKNPVAFLCSGFIKAAMPTVAGPSPDGGKYLPAAQAIECLAGSTKPPPVSTAHQPDTNAEHIFYC